MTRDPGTRAGTAAVAAVLAGAAVVLVLVTWAASIGPERVASGGRVERVEPLPTATTSAVGEAPDPLEEARRENAERGDPPLWARVVAVVLEVLVALAALAAAYWVLRRLWEALLRWRERLRGDAEPEVVDFEVVGGPGRVAAAVGADAPAQRAALETGGEPRNAIVACWHRFEEQAVAAGVAKQPWQTTGEFVLEVLDGAGAEPGAVTRLADLYREARFSDHPLTEAHRVAALAALDDVHRSLTAGAVR